MDLRWLVQIGDPADASGVSVAAHEITHTVQQGGGRRTGGGSSAGANVHGWDPRRKLTLAGKAEAAAVAVLRVGPIAAHAELLGVDRHGRILERWILRGPRIAGTTPASRRSRTGDVTLTADRAESRHVPIGRRLVPSQIKFLTLA